MELFRTRKSIAFILILLLVCIAILALYIIPGSSSATGSGRESAESVLVEYDQGAEVHLGEEIAILFPAGESTWVDVLLIGRMDCSRPPGDFTYPFRAYDIEFESGRQLAQPVRLTISCGEDIEGGLCDPSNGLLGVQLEPETGEWETLPSRYDPESRSIVCYVDHFSGVGVSQGPPTPGPTMMLGAIQQPPSGLLSIPDPAEAENIILSNYVLCDPSQSEDAVLTGKRIFIEAFDNVSITTSGLQEILGVQGLERFNSVSGSIGLLAAMTRFALEMDDPTVTDREAKAGLLQSLLSYSIGKWGWQGVQIANIGIFLMNYSLHSLGEAAVSTRFNLWWGKYDEYNRRVNPHRMDQRGWEDFMVRTAMNSVGPNPDAFRNALDERVDLYLNAFFNDDFFNIGGFWFFSGPCPDNVRDELVAKARRELLPILEAATGKLGERIRHIQERDMLELINNAAAILNEKVQIRVSVLGDSVGDPRVANLVVRVPVQEKDQHMWEGITDESGQWWMFLTRYGYYHYGNPSAVELDYRGGTYSQPLVMRPWGSFETVIFMLDDLDEGSVVRITSRPPGAAVSFDGIRTGESTPAQFEGLSAGTHELLLTLEDYEDYSTTFEWDEGADLTVHAVLDQLDGEQDGADSQATQNGDSVIPGNCWVRMDMVSRMNDSVEDPAFGYSWSISGGSGSVTDITQRGEMVVTTTAVWSEPPGTLVPGEILELPYSISQNVVNPASDISDLGTYLGYNVSRPMETSDRADMSDGDEFGSISVSTRTSPDPKSEVALIVPPEPYNRSAECYYMIRFYVGGGAEFVYIYEWNH